MPVAGFRWGAAARGVAVAALLALVTDLTDAHMHFDEECTSCIVVEVDSTAEASRMQRRPLFAVSRTVEVRAATTLALSLTPHQPRAPPALS